MKSRLQIFVIDNCPSCTEARTIASWLTQNYPELTIEVIDITNSQVAVPETVFATPTFVLNGRIVSLGNPGPDDIEQWISEVKAYSEGSVVE